MKKRFLEWNPLSGGGSFRLLLGRGETVTDKAAAHKIPRPCLAYPEWANVPRDSMARLCPSSAA
ncbi:MAG: hypothetical protein K5Q68_19110 [Roseococcus sp.]|nr:hypothetical protein [Roseococcus sp.]